MVKLGNDEFCFDSDNEMSNFADGGTGNDIFEVCDSGEYNLTGGEDADIFIIERTSDSTVTIEDYEINTAMETIIFDDFEEEMTDISDLDMTQVGSERTY